MNWGFQQPKKVLILFSLLTALGLICLNQLPVALYPNSTKPSYAMSFGLQGYTAKDFLNQYGYRFKSALLQIEDIEDVIIEGRNNSVSFEAVFKWGAEPSQVKRDLSTAYESFRGSLPYNLQIAANFHPTEQNGGFFAASIYHPTLPLSTLHGQLSPLLLPQVNAIEGVQNADLFDPNETHLIITINPEKMAYHRLNLPELQRFLSQSLNSMNAGQLDMGEKSFEVVVKNQIETFEELLDMDLRGLGRPGVKLSDVARVELGPKSEGNRIMRTNGRPSLILFAQPEDDGNIKQVCESIVGVLKSTFSAWPQGTEYKILVDPSLFIQASIRNVIMNIVFGGLLAVLILMLFVGSLRSTVFAALEIPLAIIWAFVLMKIFDVSINLISLGGLALTAGMNIDASIVMVENILRRLQVDLPQTRKEKMQSILAAAHEVRWPIVSSTLSTIIVFLPLSMTSGIAYAILGDLAKAVVFSHGFSAVVALILVPLVRAYIPLDLETPPARFFQLFDAGFQKFKGIYLSTLDFLLNKRSRQLGFLLLVGVLTLGVSSTLYPKIRKEIVALPKTDSIWLNIFAQGIHTTAELAQEIRHTEHVLLQGNKEYVDYTFTQIWSNSSAGILIRIKDKNRVDQALEAISKSLPSTPRLQFHPAAWNPSRLPIPSPPDLRLYVTGQENDRIEVAEILFYELRAMRELNSNRATFRRTDHISMEPKIEYLNPSPDVSPPSIGELAEFLRVVLSGRPIGFVKTVFGSKQIQLQYPSDIVSSTEDLAALPWVLGDKILPLKAFVSIKDESRVTALYEENGRELTKIQSRLKPEFQKKKDEILSRITQHLREKNTNPKVSLLFEDPDKEINESLMGVVYSLLMSLGLIFAVLFWQFGDLKTPLVIMSAIPLGFLGVSLALFLFDSTWSINSLLGVILLGGVAVNNSILLASFFKVYRQEGLELRQALLKSCETRLRPILITSLTTIFAMIPIAFGLGEGAEVLKPLGVAVSGGMLMSCFLTLLVVPCLLNLFTNRPSPAQ